MKYIIVASLAAAAVAAPEWTVDGDDTTFAAEDAPRCIYDSVAGKTTIHYDGALHLGFHCAHDTAAGEGDPSTCTCTTDGGDPHGHPSAVDSTCMTFEAGDADRSIQTLDDTKNCDATTTTTTTAPTGQYSDTVSIPAGQSRGTCLTDSQFCSEGIGPRSITAWIKRTHDANYITTNSREGQCAPIIKVGHYSDTDENGSSHNGYRQNIEIRTCPTSSHIWGHYQDLNSWNAMNYETDLPVDQWVHFALVADYGDNYPGYGQGPIGSLKTYLDGVQVDATRAPAWNIGCGDVVPYPDGALGANGWCKTEVGVAGFEIANFGYLDSALDASEVVEKMQATSPY